MTETTTIRPITDADLPTIVDLNQDALEGVGPLDLDSAAALVDLADQALVMEDDGDIAGFVITLPPDTPYDSSRYRWFEDRLEDYVYLDRIVVSADHRRKGVASRLYDAVEGERPIALEVYDHNEGSLAFHAGRGFRKVGELTEDGPTNIMMVRPAA
jgi:predicted GNAT superfamily acetyltransferase